MFHDEKKLTRLTAVLKMYYEQEMSQMEIAKAIGVSRPMVSKMLSEAKSLNMVTITINEVRNMEQVLSLKIEEKFKVRQAIIVNTHQATPQQVQEKIAVACYEICRDGKLPYHHVGIGFGSMIGQLAEVAVEKGPIEKPLLGDIFPLIGGIRASYKSYHSNELVRVFSEFTGLKASYMYLPALLASTEEKEIYQTTELYADAQKHWEQLNVAVINISNLYAAPDLATSLRFGARLKQGHAVGRFLAHYYDIDGNFIAQEHDNVIQADIDSLKKAKYVVGMCSDKTDMQSAIGALRTGVFTHMIITDVLAKSMIDSLEENTHQN